MPAVNFSQHIRMGDAQKIREYLKNYSTKILDARLSFRIMIELHDSFQLKRKPIPDTQLTNANLTNVKMIVSPIHIAIIAKQDEIVKAIMEYILENPSNKSNSSELRKVLSMTTALEFQGEKSIHASFVSLNLTKINISK